VGDLDRWGLSDRRLYLCTPDRTDLQHFIDACIVGGVDIVQFRDKYLSDRQVVARSEIVQRVCAHHGVPFILNDRPDLAGAIGADGVHIGQGDTPPSEARQLVGDDALIGLSTHTETDLFTALSERAPVDYLSAGPVVPTPTKPGRPGTGASYIRQAVTASHWPVWVTGGVTPAEVGDLVAAGARHFVVVRWLTEATDAARNARDLRQTIDAAISDAGTTEAQ
jgi:thiamine-phosphate pyrophosphorylase